MANSRDGCLKIIEKCKISPPPNSIIAERSLPLTFFDLVWLLFHPIHQLFFYEFPNTKADFIQTVIPKLKHSLSITLKHFFPFAGNLIVYPDGPNHSRKPEIRYLDGDSLTLTFAESSDDYNDLKGNHPRDCSKFHPLVPLLESAYKVSDLVKIPMFSILVTIFPNSGGITIGLTNHHALCDAKTRYDFLMAWTSIAKYGTDELFLAAGSLPFYDRAIKYPNSLDELFLNLPPIKNLDENYKAPELVTQTDRVRATFVFTRPQINMLKKWVLLQLPTLKYISSFTVGCAYVWSCVAKSRIHIQGKKGEDEVEQFLCVADWRSRMDPPLPETYFGNCVGPCFAPTNTKVITGNKGFPNAVELIGNAIRGAVNNKQGLFKDAETWLEKALLPIPAMGVAGTPKLDVYKVDFGWGKPEKYETISIDFSDSISVNTSKESGDDLEIGLCLPSKQMDAFIAIFENELANITSEQK